MSIVGVEHPMDDGSGNVLNRRTKLKAAGFAAMAASDAVHKATSSTDVGRAKIMRATAPPPAGVGLPAASASAASSG